MIPSTALNVYIINRKRMKRKGEKRNSLQRKYGVTEEIGTFPMVTQEAENFNHVFQSLLGVL